MTLQRGRTATTSGGYSSQTLTRAALNALRSSSALTPLRIYFLSDEPAIALTIAPNAYTNYVLDSGTVPLFSIAAPTSPPSAEGNSGNVTYTFTVTRAGLTTSSCTVDWAVAGSGGSPANSADFTAPLSGTLTFGSGVTSQPINVLVKGDTAVEPNEGFTVTLSNPSAGTITTPTASATIVNDDSSGSPVTLVDLGGSFTLSEAAVAGAVAGSLTGKASGSTLTIVDDAGGRVALSGTNIVRGLVGLNYASASSHSFTVRETLAGATNTPHDTVLTLNVTAASGLAWQYDAQWGTDTAAMATDGWIRRAAKPGTTDTYVDSVNGSDAASGNGPGANAKQTWAAAWALYLSREAANAGSRLWVAGGQGQTYIDPGNLGLWVSGYTGAAGTSTSKSLPTAIITYDSRDSANSALYGRLTRGDRPWLVFSITGTACLNIWGNQTHGYMCQGLGLKTSDDDTSVFFQALGRHDHIMFQNIVKNRVAWARQSLQTDINAYGVSVGCHWSKWSSFGCWGTGGGNEILTGQSDAHYEDYVTAHAGWKLGRERFDDGTIGGPVIFAHGIYHNPHDDTDNNYSFRRRIYGDSAADGDNLRGPAPVSDVCVALREPISFTAGGYSSSLSEHPTGVMVTRRDDLAIGGGYLFYPSMPRSWLYQTTAAKPGSTITNSLAILNSMIPTYYGTVITAGAAPGSPTFTTTIAFDKITAVGWTDAINQLTVSGGASMTFTNSKTDALISGSGNQAVTLADFPNAKTELQIYTMMLAEVGITALGHADLAFEQLMNIMCWDPTLAGRWAQRYFDKVFPLYNKTPTFQAASLPDLSAETPYKVYPADGSAATITSPTGAKNGANNANGTATINRNNGTLFAVATTSAVKPTAAQIRAGQNHLGVATPNTSLTSKSVGTKSVSLAGLVANTTYYLHYTHRTLLNQDAAVVTSASFTTDPAGVYPATTGTLGAEYGFDDFTKLWQDTAGTNPVTALGQTVRRIDPKQGDSSLYLTNSTGWVLQNNAAGKPVLIADGASAWSSVNAGQLAAANGTVSVFAVVKFVTNTNARLWLNLFNAYYTLLTGSNLTQAIAFDNTGASLSTDYDFSTTLTTGTNYVLANITSLTGVEAFTNNNSDGGATFSGSPTLQSVSGRIWDVGGAMAAGSELARLWFDRSAVDASYRTAAQTFGLSKIQ